jgi:hypothetical protein
MTRRAVRTDEAADQAGHTEEPTRGDRTAQAKAAVDLVRTRVAQLVWIVCLVAALILAIGALCIALKANQDNDLVRFFIDTADKLDLGVFSRTDGVAHWKGHSHVVEAKNACVNWGLAAVVWLIAGKVLEQVIRPRSA